jgi:beta-lactamase regulating signal transducer with metallopeptidase domain
MIWIDAATVLRMGWTLVHFLWQGAALAGVLALILWLTKGQSPRLRYGLACAVLLAMAVAPAATWYRLGQPQAASRVVLKPATQVPPASRNTATVESSSPAEGTGTPGRTWDGILPLSVGLWLFGVAIMSLRLASGWAWLQWLRRRPDTVPASDDIQLRLLRLCQRMNLASNIRILLCEKVPGPTVMGWLRPVILLPPAALLGMPADQLELVLAHELAHILRHDFAINLIQSCVEVLLFYHPAVWWVSAKIRQERELCCDDLAVRTTGDALDYAAALTRLEALCRPPGPPRHAAQALALSATGGSFMHRIRRLISPISPTPLAPRAGLVLLLLLGLSFALHAARPGTESSRITNELVLRRFNAPSVDGMAKAGQIAFDGVRVPAGFGLQALDKLAAIPVNGPITELRLAIPIKTQPETDPYSYNFPVVDPSELRTILSNHAAEKPLTLASCPLHGVIIRRMNAATPQFHPLPGKSRLSVVANEADIDLVNAALSELADLKPVPFLYQRVQRTGVETAPKARKLTIELSDVNVDEFRMVLDKERTQRAPSADEPLLESSDLGIHFNPRQLPPVGTMWLRRYDRGSADGKRRAGTVYVHVNTVTAAEITDALTQLDQAPRDAANGYVDLEVKADVSNRRRDGLFTYIFLGVDPARMRRVVHAWNTFPFLSQRPEDKKAGQIIIQRNNQFTPEIGVLSRGLKVQVWAGDVSAEAVFEALKELMAVTPDAGVPQEVRRQIPPGSGQGKRISLDLRDKDPEQLWDELEVAMKGQH